MLQFLVAAHKLGKISKETVEKLSEMGKAGAALGSAFKKFLRERERSEALSRSRVEG